MDAIGDRFVRKRTAETISLDFALQMPVHRAQLGFASCTLWVTLSVFPVAVPAVSTAGTQEEHVSVGQATVQTVSPTTPSLGRASEATILNWNSFSFVTHEAVGLIQPSVYSIALNRLIGVDQSVILGHLPSNSQVILINPHRNPFGNPVQVNTGEFLATTLQIRTDADRADPISSAQNPLRGLNAVVNSSTIHVSEHGYVALVTPGVSTEGVIVANLGTSRSDPEQKVTLDLMSDGLIRYAISKRTLSQMTGLNDSALASTASNRRTRQAGGGQILVGARSAGDILSAVVNTGGVSRARRLVNRGGVVRLEGDDPSLVRAAGTMDASGMTTDRRGGKAPVFAESASVPDSAQMDVPVRSNKRTALLSGNGHGQKVTSSGTSTHTSTDSTLKAAAPLNHARGTITPKRPSSKGRQDISQTSKSVPPVPGHPQPKSASTSALLGVESVPQATAPSNGGGEKVNPRKSSPKVRQDKPQSTSSSSAVWRQPKWNFPSDSADASGPTSGNGQDTSPAASQPAR